MFTGRLLFRLQQDADLVTVEERADDAVRRAVDRRVDDVAGHVMAHVERVGPLVAIQVARIRPSLLRLHGQLREQRRVVDPLAGHVLHVEGEARREALRGLQRQPLER
jgi:hypothetical protein